MSPLVTRLEARREELVHRWREALHRGLSREPSGHEPSAQELSELLQGLLHALGENASAGGLPAPPVWLQERGELPLVLAVYESLGEVVADMLREADAEPSPGEARTLTRFIISGVSAALKAASVRERAGRAADPRQLNAVLQERQGRQHALAADIGQALSQVATEEQLLQACTAALVRHEDAALARIWLLSDDGNILQLKASSGLYSMDEGPHHRVAMGQFKMGRVAQERAPALFNALGGEERSLEQAWARQEGLVSFAGHPLLLGERLFGVMALFARRPLSPDTLGSLKQIADGAVLGLERLRIAHEREQLLRSEQTARQEAEEANRLKDEFLATVSHELRTPLTAMLGWVQVLRNGNLPQEKRERALETVERNARAQGQLIEDLLDVSRIMSGKLKLDVEPLEVSAVVEQALESVRPAADAKGLRIQTALDSTGHVMGDAHRLQQVVWNLLSNAVKFTPKGGRVQVFVERRDSSVEITVADTGPGIASDFLPHVFERFRRADGPLTRRAGGLGLGLSIVKQLVEMHGGTVNALSEGPGLGATFTVRLPLSVAVRREVALPPSAQSHPGIPCPPELSGLRVLVVDDELDTRELLRTLLEGCRAQVTTAASVAEGLTLLKELRPDVLVSDIGMPGEDGYSLISHVRALSPKEGGRTPAVALTAYARVEDRTRVLLAGFHNHVPKPVEPVELLAVLASLSGRFGAVRP